MHLLTYASLLYFKLDSLSLLPPCSTTSSGMEGVEATDTCLEYVESTTTSILETSRTDGNGVLSLQHVCNLTTTAESGANATESTESGRLTNVWYSTDDCDEEAVSYEFFQDVCQATCTADGGVSVGLPSEFCNECLISRFIPLGEIRYLDV